MAHYVIRNNSDSGLAWSDEKRSFVRDESYTVFSGEEIAGYPLPMNGRWVKLED